MKWQKVKFLNYGGLIMSRSKVVYYVDSEVMKQIRQFAEDTNRKYSNVIELALREFLERHKENVK